VTAARTSTTARRPDDLSCERAAGIEVRCRVSRANRRFGPIEALVQLEQVDPRVRKNLLAAAARGLLRTIGSLS
jgi:hypothetical protein